MSKFSKQYYQYFSDIIDISNEWQKVHTNGCTLFLAIREELSFYHSMIVRTKFGKLSNFKEVVFHTKNAYFERLGDCLKTLNLNIKEQYPKILKKFSKIENSSENFYFRQKDNMTSLYQKKNKKKGKNQSFSMENINFLRYSIKDIVKMYVQEYNKLLETMKKLEETILSFKSSSISQNIDIQTSKEEEIADLNSIKSIYINFKEYEFIKTEKIESAFELIQNILEEENKIFR